VSEASQPHPRGGLIVAVVQARFSSRRLPGKVLRPMRGRPLLGYVLEALSHARGLDGIVVATSSDREDDAIVAFARDEGIPCHRGPLENVAARVLGAARSLGADALVRVSGDSPLLDPVLVDLATEMFRKAPADLVSNVVERSFPRGQSVEVLARNALERALPLIVGAYDREHVTPYFYAHRDQFTIRSFTAAVRRPDVQLSVDDGIDFERCEAILGALGAPPWGAGWEACVHAYDALTGTACS
jgi:spore coat polysaccharide biosynthesis protein SpsF